MKRYGCKYGLPHDLGIVQENKSVKVEVCHICNRRFRWPKGVRGRVNNVKYLEAHARNFAQQHGKTKRLFHKLYQPEKCVIKI